MIISDAWPPKESEVFAWAYSDECWPHQDWDVILMDMGMDFLQKIVVDKDCPKRDVFIHVLYRLVGHAVYMENVERQAELLGKIQQLNPFGDRLMDQWRDESLAMLQGKTEFSYDYWMNHMLEDL